MVGLHRGAEGHDRHRRHFLGFRERCRVRGIDVQVIAGDNVEVVPEFLAVVLLGVDLRVQDLHHLDYRGGLTAPLLFVWNRLEAFDHTEYVPAIFRHSKSLSLCVVVEFYIVL